MAINYLVDTDVLIDWLAGERWTRALFLNPRFRIYCSNVSGKELLAKRGLTNRERRQIWRLLKSLRVIHVDSTIATAAANLMRRYKNRPLRVNDALIAATAQVKHLHLVNTQCQALRIH